MNRVFPEIHVHPERKIVISSGKRVFADVIMLKRDHAKFRVGPKSKMTGVLIRRRKFGPRHTGKAM